ncbi:class I SAM-dependent methyltransferase [Eisenibacter elegans]|jgi:SAM-dependent methyltransferase|uniref:class I SAM-dependent methyltransferase n=1 Tax=Eisenibacter elegans TaxID=997 RepID=UPI000412603E|nr:class I SAM-dependent methyltransferase [Eisenibacter elegans]
METLSTNTATWFSTWFDSPYYHILYKNRDEREAKAFIDRLSTYLALSPTEQILDVACGRGRHARMLHDKGFCVTGIDLAPHSIAYASAYADERLQFFVHDMREVFRPEGFDVVLNLFTSFGYFDTEAENLEAIQAMAANLKPQGRLVIDFLNPTVVIASLQPIQQKTVEGITFHLHKRYEAGYIVKDIRFEDQGQTYHFQERVRAINQATFERYFEAAGLQLKAVYGDYAFAPYVAEASERLIFITQKA